MPADVAGLLACAGVSVLFGMLLWVSAHQGDE